MSTIEAIRRECLERGITRLCHVTQARNLPHIIEAGQILSARALQDRDLPINPNDIERLDGHDDHISCSIQYPNVWFLNQVAARELIFRDWVVLTIAPDYLWQTGTLFSPVNAAKGAGRYIADGANSFEGLFAQQPRGSRFSRSMFHMSECPTDDQAEVLVPGPIAFESILAIIFPSHDAAQTERERLGILGRSTGDAVWKVSPEMYDARRLAGRIRSGERVSEEIAVGNASISRESR